MTIERSQTKLAASDSREAISWKSGDWPFSCPILRMQMFGGEKNAPRIRTEKMRRLLSRQVDISLKIRVRFPKI